MMLRKKIVYVISWRFSGTDGVTRKTFEQLGEWAKSFDILLIWLENGSEFPELNNVKIPAGLEVSIHLVRTNPRGYLKVMQQVANFDPDYVYARYPFFHPLIYVILSRYPSVLEINTLEKKEMLINLEKKRSLAFRGIYHTVMITRNFFLSKAKAIFFVTEELRDHSDYLDFPNRYFIPNSISSTHFIDFKKVNKTKPIDLLFIGTHGHSWHGIDKIEMLAKLTPDFNYHIVGAAGTNTSNIIYHGEMNKPEIKTLMTSVNICIGSLSLDVLGLSQACPLKVREYIAAGFPVVLGYDDAAFHDELPEWVFKASFDPLNLPEFIDFCVRNEDFVVSTEDKNKYICLEKFEQERMIVIQGIDAKASS
jgi:glycosyltransferase involved in cell wall biosynthesis